MAFIQYFCVIKKYSYDLCLVKKITKINRQIYICLSYFHFYQHLMKVVYTLIIDYNIYILFINTYTSISIFSITQIFL